MKIFSISKEAKVYAYIEPVSMNRSFPGLSSLVESGSNKKPDSGDLYIFINKKKTYVKVLFYEKGGFCIFAKQLPNGIFDADGISDTMSILALEKVINQVIVHGAKKLRHLKKAA